MGRLSLGLGLGVGYVLGAQAGRARYEQIRRAAAGLLERPEVQQTLERARSAAPAPLQGSLDMLTGRASGGQGTGSGTGAATGDATPPPSAAPGSGGSASGNGAVPDPLVPPGKSADDAGGQ